MRRSSDNCTRSATTTGTNLEWDRCWPRRIKPSSRHLRSSHLLDLQGQKIRPQPDQSKAERHARAKSDENASEGTNQEILGEVSVFVEFVRPDYAFGRHKKRESGIAAGGDHNRQDDPLKIADQTAAIVFLDIDSRCCWRRLLHGRSDLNRRWYSSLRRCRNGKI